MIHTRTIAQDPPITVDIHFENGKIEKINLSLSPESKFICRFFNLENSEGLEENVHLWLELYAQRQNPVIDLPLKEVPLSPFSSQVLSFIKQLPFATTASYKEVACQVGSPKAARAVGNSCHLNPFPLIIPCHRIIYTNGKIGGFAYDRKIKECLLTFENL